MEHRLGLIDYGMGNLHSVKQGFKRLGESLKTISSPAELTECDALILPGVGAFDPAMENLNKTSLVPYIKDWAFSKKPLLGICLGLQLLFEFSEEGNSSGLGILKGNVNKLPSNQGERIPHMGWALLDQTNDCPLLDKRDQSNWMYFVHSYSAITKNEEDLAATINFGDSNVTALVWKDRIGACQFHPEKSGKAGEKMLKRWLDWLKDLPKEEK